MISKFPNNHASHIVMVGYITHIIWLCQNSFLNVRMEANYLFLVKWKKKVNSNWHLRYSFFVFKYQNGVNIPVLIMNSLLLSYDAYLLHLIKCNSYNIYNSHATCWNVLINLLRIRNINYTCTEISYHKWYSLQIRNIWQFHNTISCTELPCHLYEILQPIWEPFSFDKI